MQPFRIVVLCSSSFSPLLRDVLLELDHVHVCELLILVRRHMESDVCIPGPSLSLYALRSVLVFNYRGIAGVATNSHRIYVACLVTLGWSPRPTSTESFKTDSDSLTGYWVALTGHVLILEFVASL